MLISAYNIQFIILILLMKDRKYKSIFHCNTIKLQHIIDYETYKGNIFEGKKPIDVYKIRKIYIKADFLLNVYKTRNKHITNQVKQTFLYTFTSA